MNENTVEGQARSTAGKVEAATGQALGRDDLEAKGKAQDVLGAAQQAFGQAKDTAARVGGQAKDAYEAASAKAQEFAGAVDPFVKEKPYLALGAAALIGFLAARLLAPGGPKVIYVKPRD